MVNIIIRKYILINKKMTKLGSLFLYIVFFILWNIQKIVCQLTKYEIYESSNSYTRPVLLEGNDVLALSGKTTGYMIKYNKKMR